MPTLTLLNARIHTMNPGHAFASGLVIDDGLITRLIPASGNNPHTNTDQVLDLQGRIILPGLIDSHLHLQKYAENLNLVDCETSTKHECLERVAARSRETPAGNWILGHGWNHNNWEDGYGSALDLDQICPNNPVYLTGKSLHVSWVNSRALELAGISDTTPDPPGGMIQRDAAGKPTGILFEDAVNLIETLLPQPGIEETARSIASAQKSLWKLGLTGGHDFDREQCLKALFWLEEHNQLAMRIQKSIPSAYLDQALGQNLRTGEGSNFLWIGGVKDFADGALGPQTAAMLAPYQGTNNLGLNLLDLEEIIDLGTRAAKGGLALAIHAIGDLANRTVINAIQQVRKYELEQGFGPLPHRIEHVQLIDPGDVKRLAELEIIASMQPIHATSDLEMADAYWGERTAFAYAPRPLIDQGTLVIFGSDAPVESPNPWLGIHAAVTRQRADGFPGPDGWHPEGRLTVEEALRGFTVNPALAAGRGNLQGKLAPGYWADLIVLEMDPFKCPVADLRTIEPVGTMVDGKWVYRSF